MQICSFVKISLGGEKMKEITLGQFYPVESIVHRLDPRTKILGVMVIIALSFVAKTFLGLAVSLLFILIAGMLARVPFMKLFSSLKAIWFLLLFTFLLNCFFTKGDDIIFSWRFLTLTWDGLTRALFMALRLIVLIIGASLLTLTTSPIRLTDGIENLLSPLKKIGFPSHEIAMMMSIALRFIPILSEETDKIMKAQSARGAVFDRGNIFVRAKNLVSLLIPLLAGAFHRAIELANAMEARCYHGGEGRTRLKMLKMHACDAWAFVILALFIAALITDNLLISKLLPFLVG